jgi:hypothetical protein
MFCFSVQRLPTVFSLTSVQRTEFKMRTETHARLHVKDQLLFQFIQNRIC